MKANNTTIRVCMGTGGIAAGGAEVLNAFKKELNLAGIKANVEKTAQCTRSDAAGFVQKMFWWT